MTHQADITRHDLDLTATHAAEFLDRAHEVLIGRPAIDCVVEPTKGDDEGLLLVAAKLLATQFHVINRLCISPGDRRDAIDAMGAHADRAGAEVEGLSAAALGAMSMFLESFVCNDHANAGKTLAAALDVFDIEELFDAAAVLLVSMTFVVADRLALDPLTVHTELRANVGTLSDRSAGSCVDVELLGVGAAGCRRAVVEGNPAGATFRPGRQTWSGRNSQCQGSRGTDSTQPNRGPFVFSH